MSSDKNKNFTMIPNKLIRCGRALTPHARVVFSVLKSYTPRSFPSYTKIQEVSGLSRKSVSKAIKELVRAEVVSIVHRGSFRGRSNEYKINTEEQWELPSVQSKLGANGNQDKQVPVETDTSFPLTLQQGSEGNSKKTQEKDFPNNTTEEGFDFEALYQRYPMRKDGNMRKREGMAVCREKIKTKEQYEKLSKAVENYDAYIKYKKKQDRKFEYIFNWRRFIEKDEWLNWAEQEPQKERQPLLFGGDCDDKNSIL